MDLQCEKSFGKLRLGPFQPYVGRRLFREALFKHKASYCFTSHTEAPHKVGFIWIRDVLLTLLKLHTKRVLFGSGMFYSPYWSFTQSDFYLDQGCFTYLTEAPHKVIFTWIRDVLLTLLKLQTKRVLFGSGMFYLPYWSSTQSDFYLDQGCFTYLAEAPHKEGFIWIRHVLLTLLKLHTKWFLFGSGMFYLPYWSSTQSEFYLDQGCFTYLTKAPHKVSFIWIRNVFQAQYTVKWRVFCPNRESINLVHYYVQIMSVGFIRIYITKVTSICINCVHILSKNH